jgi:hypothetical protein
LHASPRLYADRRSNSGNAGRKRAVTDLLKAKAAEGEGEAHEKRPVDTRDFSISECVLVESNAETHPIRFV